MPAKRGLARAENRLLCLGLGMRLGLCSRALPLPPLLLSALLRPSVPS